MKRKPTALRRKATTPMRTHSATARRAVPRKPIANVVPAGGARVATCQIAGHFPLTLRRQLKHLEAASGRTLQDLLGEAIADLLAKRTKQASR